MDFSITLIRHGKTLATEKNLYCGNTDMRLTKKGENEILDLKEKHIYPKCDIFFTSQMRRTTQTLKLIYGKNINYTAINELNEQNLGNLDMKSYDDIKEIPLYKKWLNDTSGSVKCPNGESLNDFKLRVKLGFHKLLEDVKTNDKPSAVLVSHGGVIAIIMDSIFENKQPLNKWQPEFGLGYTLSYSKNKFVNYKKISFANT